MFGINDSIIFLDIYVLTTDLPFWREKNVDVASFFTFFPSIYHFQFSHARVSLRVRACLF